MPAHLEIQWHHICFLSETDGWREHGSPLVDLRNHAWASDCLLPIWGKDTHLKEEYGFREHCFGRFFSAKKSILKKISRVFSIYQIYPILLLLQLYCDRFSLNPVEETYSQFSKGGKNPSKQFVVFYQFLGNSLIHELSLLVLSML